MKTLNKSLLATLTLSAALALTGCGGGDSGSGNSVPAGTVGTAGDGANQGEYDAIQKGMTREQVIAIMADAPTYQSSLHVEWVRSSVNVTVAFQGPDGGASEKAILINDKITNRVIF